MIVLECGRSLPGTFKLVTRNTPFDNNTFIILEAKFRLPDNPTTPPTHPGDGMRESDYRENVGIMLIDDNHQILVGEA